MRSGFWCSLRKQQVHCQKTFHHSAPALSFSDYGESRNAKAYVLDLEADDGLAAEAAVAKLFEQLSHSVQFNRGADARGDRAVREHARNLAQPLRR